MQKFTVGLCLFILLLWTACQNERKPKNTSQGHIPSTKEQIDKAQMEQAEAKSIDTLTVLSSKLPPDAAKAIIEFKAQKVVDLISRKAFASIGKEYAHPVHGVRFSPYPYINLKTNQVYSGHGLMHAWGDSTSINWGVRDGEGGDILLPFHQYYTKYIYNKNYETSKKVKYNATEGTGNMIDNRDKAYPNAIMVEYYLDGTNPDFGGMDWGSLRLFFEVHRDKWWLVGIAHGEWAS